MIGVKCSVCCFCKLRQIENAFIFWCWNFLTSCMTLFATLPNNYNRWLVIQIVTKEYHSGAKLWKLMPILSALLCFCHSFPQHHFQEDGPKDNSFEWTSTNQSHINEVSKWAMNYRQGGAIIRLRSDENANAYKCNNDDSTFASKYLESLCILQERRTAHTKFSWTWSWRWRGTEGV